MHPPYEKDSRISENGSRVVTSAIIIVVCMFLGLVLVATAALSDERPDDAHDLALQAWATSIDEQLEERRLAAAAKRGGPMLVPGTGFTIPPGSVAVHTRHAVRQCTPECDKGCDDPRSPFPCVVPNCGTVIDLSARIPPVSQGNDAELLAQAFGETNRTAGCILWGGGDHGFRARYALAQRCLKGEFPAPPVGAWDCEPTREEMLRCQAVYGPGDPFYNVLPQPPEDRPPVTPPQVDGETKVFRCKPCPPLPGNPNPGVRSTGRLRNQLLPPDYRMEVELFCPCGVEP